VIFLSELLIRFQFRHLFDPRRPTREYAQVRIFPSQFKCPPLAIYRAG
jgi:hypothetical protein